MFPSVRRATSVVNFAKVSEKLTPQHAAEFQKLKAINSTVSATVNELPATLPKIDFTDLKKKMPGYASILDSLQKQYETIKIPKGTIPEEYNKQINEFTAFNEARIKIHNEKTAIGSEEAKKVEDKWSKAPPVEHFDRQMFPEYFPQIFYDLRVDKRLPDPCNLGINNEPSIQTRFRDYKVLTRPDKVEDH
ncbi:ATPase, F0 complex, subunit D, mitochondrial family-containing protein [Strongyloides ratti]|uniref:ATP synthase subunit d, mitochondrial n=1 Tax=Strongyloides ratti TaxID=34506 RepID=A0A090LAJ2_STRRB|nr:ATPase, F0 complex, subunit D, mitochondrial family-containing protein [Strongyloides ratti]CEF66752.1 ATPase, F0 complex, subunit D, mitochondrial family-containing protein [Strongyloides ratti]